MERSFAYSDSFKNHEEQVINLDRTRFVRFEDCAELAAVIREVMYEGDKCTSLFDVQQLLEVALGDSKAGRSGILVFSSREHRIGVIVVSGLGKCYNRTKMHLSFVTKR